MHALSSTVTLSFSLSLFLSPISLPRLPSLLVHSTWPSSIRLSRSSLRFVSFSCMLQPRDAPSSAFVLCTYAYTHADTLFYFSPSSLPSLFLSVSLSSFLLLLCPCRVLPLSSFILTLHSQAIRVSFRPARRATSVPPSVLSLCSFSSPISLANLKPLVSLLRHFLPRLLLLRPCLTTTTVTSAPYVSVVPFIRLKLACKLPRRLTSKLSCPSSPPRSLSQWTHPSACTLGVQPYYQRFHPSRKQPVLLLPLSLFVPWWSFRRRTRKDGQG